MHKIVNNQVNMINIFFVCAFSEDSLVSELIDDDDDCMDSGIGAEKSESGSSDIPMLSTEEAKTEDRPGASTSADSPIESHLSAFKLTNLRFISGTRNRNYRLRSLINPSINTDSDDDTRMDSDDNSIEEQPERNNSSDDR